MIEKLYLKVLRNLIIMRVTNQNNEEVSNPFCSLLWKGRQCKSKSNMNKNINLKYSVKGFSDAKATEYLEDLNSATL